MTRLTGLFILAIGIVVFLGCAAFVLKAAGPQNAFAPLALKQLLAQLTTHATVFGVLGLLLAASGVLVLKRSRHARVACAVSGVAVLAAYGNLLRTMATPSLSDVLLLSPILLLLGIGAITSIERRRRLPEAT